MKIYQILKIAIITLIIIHPFAITTILAQDDNIVTGEGSGENISSGDYISIFGNNSGVNLTSSSYSTLFGYQAGYSFTGADNTCFGYLAGHSSTSGGNNLMIGAFSGYNNTNSDNTFLGYEAGYSNTTGNDNIFLGYKAGKYSEDGNDNICIGYLAGFYSKGDNNVYIGENVGYGSSSTSSTGSSNVGIGGYYSAESGIASFQSITSGSNNTALGFNSGSKLKEGNQNTFIGVVAGGFTKYESEGHTLVGYSSGFRTGYSTRTENNTFVGYLAGENSYTGDESVLMGYNADVNNTSYTEVLGFGADVSNQQSYTISLGYSGAVGGQYAIGIGYENDINNKGSIGIGYEVNTANGNFSIGIGSNADIDNSYGIGIGANVDIDNTNGIAIGHNTTANGDYSIAYGTNATVTGSNSIALGNNVSVSTDNTITIGNAQITSIRGTVNWTTLSDGRYKRDVKENVSGLAFINRLRPVSYELNSQKGIRYSGFIAQEVEQAAENVDYDFSGVKKPESEDDIYGLRYAEFVVPLTKAVQELEEQHQLNEIIISKNEEKLQEYKNAIAIIQAKVELLKNVQISNKDTSQQAFNQNIAKPE